MDFATFFEVVYGVCMVIICILLALASILLGKICQIRKWEIEEERNRKDCEVIDDAD